MVSHVLIFQILIGINMKFTIKWLREYLDFDSTIKELSECLTGLGLEVESIINPYAYLNDFKVCLIKKVYKHPNADKLKICEVFDGLKSINVVCGAKNAQENLVTVLAPVGVTLPTINKVEGIKIKKGLIRDIESNGMLCSAEELGLEKSSEGIIKLNETNEIGFFLLSVLNLDGGGFSSSSSSSAVPCDHSKPSRVLCKMNSEQALEMYLQGTSASESGTSTKVTLPNTSKLSGLAGPRNRAAHAQCADASKQLQEARQRRQSRAQRFLLSC